MNKYSSIVCCCSNGLGSSMILELNVKEVLKEMGINGVYVSHIPISEANSASDDLYVFGSDVSSTMKSFRKVVAIHNLLSKEEIREKLNKAFQCKEKQFWIE